MEISGNPFKIIVKPNSAKNEVLGFDKHRDAYRVNIKARAQDNKANVEVVKFLSRLLKKRVRIVSGLRSREKLIGVE